jgi:putative transposase
MYSKQEKETVLQLYDKTGSVSAVVQRLEYPTREELYRWIYERKIKNRKKILRRYKNTEHHPIHPDIDLKIEVLHRCFESGESIESVSEETGYSRQSIYAWRRKYLQKELLTLVPQKDISRGKIMADYKTTFQSNGNPGEITKNCPTFCPRLQLPPDFLNIQYIYDSIEGNYNL